jgi:hypothetical protein
MPYPVSRVLPIVQVFAYLSQRSSSRHRATQLTTNDERLMTTTARFKMGKYLKFFHFIIINDECLKFLGSCRDVWEAGLPRAGPVLFEHFCFKRLQYSHRAPATPLQVFFVRTQCSHGFGGSPVAAGESLRLC